MNANVREWLVNEVIGMEDEELLASLYADYLFTFDDVITSARLQIASGDFAELDVTAHTLKGASLAVGDTEVYEASLVLRDAAKASDAAGVASAEEAIESLRAAR